MRLRLLLMLVLGLALLGASPALAADIEVETPDGEVHEIDLDNFGKDPDVENESYPLRSPQRTDQEQVVDGYSLPEVIRAAGEDSFQMESAEIEGTGGSSVTLDHDQINLGGSQPPVVYEDARGDVAFLRPSEGPNDFNAGDKIIVPLQISLTAVEGAVTVDAKASDTEIAAGEKVSFSGKVLDGDPSSVSFEWTVNGALYSPDLNPRPYKFKREGEYKVILTPISKATGEKFTADGFEVIVGEPKESDKDRDGGGTEDDGTDTGAYDGGSGYTYPSTGTGYDTGASFPSTGEGLPETPKTKVPETAPSGETVTGEVLSEVAPEEPPAEEESATLQTGTEEDDEGGGVPGAVVASVSVLSLLGLGALREVRL
jgi:hypothetical protein